MKNEREIWIRIGELSKNINEELRELKGNSNGLIPRKTMDHLNKALDEINMFRNKAENEMFLSGIEELNIFYGKEEPEKTINKFLRESDYKNERISSSELYNDYLNWSDDNNLKPITITSFGKEMSKRFKKVKVDRIYYIMGDSDA